MQCPDNRYEWISCFMFLMLLMLVLLCVLFRILLPIILVHSMLINL